MPYEVSEYMEGRVIYMRGEGIITVQDLQMAAEEIATYLQQVSPQVVHLFHNGLTIVELPIDVVAASKAAQVALQQPNLGWVIHVSDKGFVNFIASVVAQAAKVRFSAFEDEDDAWQFLRSRDESLEEFIQ